MVKGNDFIWVGKGKDTTVSPNTASQMCDIRKTAGSVSVSGKTSLRNRVGRGGNREEMLPRPHFGCMF
jgi:hypothetical protein